MPRTRQHPVRRGFTLIEVLLALFLATFVVAAAMGVLGLVTQSQKQHTGDIHQSVRIAQTQQFFRDMFVRLVAGVPLVPEADDPAALLEQASGEGDADEETPEQGSSFDALLNNLLDGGLASQLLEDGELNINVMFEIYFDPEVQGWPVPVLECVVTDPPIPESDPFFEAQLGVLDQLGFVRSVLRLEPQGDGLYALVFIPTDPVGEPYVVLENLSWMRFYVLPERDAPEWTEVHAAYLEEDFPPAVRVVLFMADGQEIDWMFEVQAIVPEGAS